MEGLHRPALRCVVQALRQLQPRLDYWGSCIKHICLQWCCSGFACIGMD